MQVSHARLAARAGSVTLAVLLATAAHAHGRGRQLPQLPPATPATLVGTCESLAGRLAGLDGSTTITGATTVAAGALSVAGAPVPAHCRITGRSFEHLSPVDGKTYSIQFEMRLPVAWNGRFFHQGNGGIDGAVVTANAGFGGGAADHAAAAGLCGAELRRRPQQRAGRPGLRPGSAGAARLRLPGRRQADADGQAGHCRWPTAKGRTARTSAAAPTAGATRWWPPHATRRTTTATSPARRATTCRWRRWPTSSARSATPPWPPATRPRRRAWRPPSPRPSAACWPTPCWRAATVSTAPATAWCRTPRTCQRVFDLDRDVPTCPGARDGSCLSMAQKTAIAPIFSGATLCNGRPFYAPFPYDSGIAGGGIPFWEFTAPLVLDSGAVGVIFKVPPSTRRADQRAGLQPGPGHRHRLDRSCSPPMPPTPKRPCPS